eukprot:4125822-Ditylum_brightwellii.AAC.1
MPSFLWEGGALDVGKLSCCIAVLEFLDCMCPCNCHGMILQGICNLLTYLVCKLVALICEFLKGKVTLRNEEGHRKGENKISLYCRNPVGYLLEGVNSRWHSYLDTDASSSHDIIPFVKKIGQHHLYASM